jgi:hypothetical protein
MDVSPLALFSVGTNGRSNLVDELGIVYVGADEKERHHMGVL